MGRACLVGGIIGGVVGLLASVLVILAAGGPWGGFLLVAIPLTAICVTAGVVIAGAVKLG